MSASLPSTPIKGNGASQRASRRASIASSRPVDEGDEHSSSLVPPSNHHQQQHHDDSSSPASHFFTSVLSAAQNAASSLTGLKGNGGETGRQRSMSDPSEFFQNYEDGSGEGGASDDVEREISDSPAPAHGVNDVVIEPIRSAISTLGKGELSLASLGLAEDGNEQASVKQNSMYSHKDEEEDEEESLLSDTKSLMETGSLNHRSRKNTTDSAGIGAEFNQGGALAVPIMSRSKSRASSLISKQRKRRSSSTEDEDEDGVVGGGGARRSTNRITGFAYANKKRNKDFHRLFRSVTTDDYLLDDFSCALSREILIHGRLYVSERHICFNSNILGWVTNLIIGFDEIVTLEKKNTAGLFPNGIIIQTLHARHSFASFVSRDTTLEFLTSVWKQASPHQARLEGGNSMLNLAGGGEDFDYKSSDEDEEDEDGDGSERNNNNNTNNLDDMTYESDEGASLGSFGSSESLFTDDNDVSDDNGSEVQEDAVQTEDSPPQQPQTTATAVGGSEGGGVSGGWPVGNLGPETHSVTDPGDPESNGEKLLANELIPAPLGVVVNLLFGEDTSFMRRLIVDVQKNTNLNDYSSFGKENTRKYDYIKPLNGPVGPKQTRCICTDTVEEWDLEKRVVVVTATQTPDVPSGGSFVTKSRYSLAWGENNQTKLLFSFWTEWSGKSWIKGAIERGSQDGQTQFSKDLVSEINALLKGAKKRKAPGKAKKPAKAKKAKKHRQPEGVTTADKTKAKDERLAGIFKRVGEIMNTEISSLLPIPIWGITIILLLIYIFMARPHITPQAATRGSDSLSSMMLEEEYEVWKWIDDRVSANPNTQYKPPAPQDIEKAYGRQELAESIRITQNRLNLLKDKLDI
ncbi:hypothetical protein TRICI_003720 [Trichomonascus ciferrii]|uniref:VASt domain-containing protein n=1 Tax=Trichomonascus ciferrii TaxID=44093 RepID=A0A642V4B1_9ASCO|nr:hypothetical protein TRICI_003720 [Trichomonascus ciferrii]